MKTLTRTIIVFVTLSLITAGFASDQSASDEETLAAQRQDEVAAKAAQRQAEAAQKQMQAAQRQMEATQRQMEASVRQVAIAQEAIPALPVEPMPVSIPSPTPPRSMFSTGYGSMLGSRSGSTGTVLVIPSAEIKAEDIVAVTEDMNVMARIFEKNLQQARISAARGGLFLSGDYVFGTLLGRGRGAIQSMYLQGYGAVFLMKVDFPLSPPPQAEEKEEAEKKGDTDPVWDQMKRDMYEPQAARRRKADRPAEKYDAEKVENLKTTVINALKHAANIRNLKPDESVVVTITGSGASVSNVTTLITKAGKVVIQDKDRNTIRIADAPQPGDLGLSAPTVLTIRVKKSDIDGLARGDFDLDQFRQRVQMLSYPLLGGAAGSEDYHKSFMLGTGF